MEVRNAQELEAVLKKLEPGKQVKIVYKTEGKEVVLEGTAKTNQ